MLDLCDHTFVLDLLRVTTFMSGVLMWPQFNVSSCVEDEEDSGGVH